MGANLPPTRTYASSAPPRRAPAARAPAAQASATFEFTPGARVEWSPVLTAGLTIVGSAIDEEGRPLSGWGVSARPTHLPRTPRHVQTDAQGRFEFTNLEQLPYTGASLLTCVFTATLLKCKGVHVLSSLQ